MCGIFGEFGPGATVTDAVYERLSRLLRHRGPADEGLERGDGWWVGFRRLSILDLNQTGHQPMTTPDGRFWLVFNGEIYNYRELRAGLEARGVTFRGGSDTEVLLHLLAREGADALGRLNGMFALALVDTLRRRFLLARDRLGVKPFYLRRHGGRLAFASEQKALLALPDATRSLSPHGVASYLSLGYLPGGACVFEGYTKLPPGHLMTGSLDEPQHAEPRPYWSLEVGEDGGRPAPRGDALLDEFEAILEDSVRIRLRSDVPVGVFLSGGLDSGVVAALAARINADPAPLALTVGFDDDRYDETALAEATARHVGLEHRVIPQRAAGLADVDRIAWFYDEPFADVSALPTMLLCEVAARHATVFLTGDGGDEALGGYRRYIEAQRYAWLDRLPAALLRGTARLARTLPADSRLGYRLAKASLPDFGLAAVFDGQGLTRDRALEMVLPRWLRGELPGASGAVWHAWERSRGRGLLARQRALDYALYLPDDILVKMDRASMAHSIEARSPFLDYRLVEWAARLPAAALVEGGMGKQPLRALAARLLPDTVRRAAKRGFGVPIGDWMRRPEGGAFVRDRLLSAEAGRRGLWDPAGTRRLIDLHQAGRGRDFGELLWRLLMLDAWARHYLDGATIPEQPPAGAAAARRSPTEPAGMRATALAPGAGTG